MDKENIGALCKKTVATVHCQDGDFKVTWACVAIVTGIILFHMIACKCNACTVARLKKKACKCSEKPDA